MTVAASGCRAGCAGSGSTKPIRAGDSSALTVANSPSSMVTIFPPVSAQSWPTWSQ
jgi:hypothetical protein